MKSIRRCLLLALLLLVAAVPAEAAVHEVDMFGAQFDPEVVHAAAGDTIEWTVSGGSHTVTAFGGDDFHFPDMGPGDTASVVFGGGTVLYYCQIHAIIDEVSGVCDGMCGAITNRTNIPAPPQITSPEDGGEEDSQTVRVTGTGEPFTTAIVSENDFELGEAVANESGLWQVDIEFSTGEHTITARSVDVEDRESAESDPVSFTVSADETPPTTTITTGSPAVFTGPAVITGTATDGVAVARVDVEITLGALQTILQATCTGCGTPNATWVLQGGVPAGAWLVRARATDTAGNTGPASPDIIVVRVPVSG